MKQIITVCALALTASFAPLNSICASEVQVPEQSSQNNSEDIFHSPYVFLYFGVNSPNQFNGRTSSELRELRNAIYARHGYIFKDNELRKFFSQYSWYHPQYDNVDGSLTVAEKINLALIMDQEERLKSNGGDLTTCNPFLFLSKQRLTRNDLKYLESDDLAIIRNAIYATHGYIFKNEGYSNYFGYFSWYHPQYDDVSGMLNSIEQANVALIKSMEKANN